MTNSQTNNNWVYFNDPQLDVMYTAANTTVFVGGRRIGKSHGLAAPFSQRNTQKMPGSTGGVVGTTYQQLLTRTLPGTITALERLGFERDKHFFIGRKPPRAANFEKPIYDPPSYDNAVAWYNGTIWRLISQDRPGTSNSLTLDWGLFDEAKFLSYEKLKDETFPAMGGDSTHFDSSPYYRSKLIISDMPTTRKGSWFLKYKDMTDEQLLKTIRETVLEKFRIEELARKNGPTDGMRRYHRELQFKLAKLRSVAIYYKEWSTIENMAIVGEKYIRDMKRDLSPLVFATSIMSKRVTKLRDGFYSALNEDVHYYENFDYSHLDGLDYNFEKLQEQSCLQDADVDMNKPISVAFDYNANINWLVAGQRSGIKMHTLKSFFVKYERKLREVVQDFCNYYRFHHTREVIYYYDNTALGTNYAVGDDDFANTICDEFIRQKWKVTRVHIGNPIRHVDKHRMIYEALKGQKYLFPLFNKHHNEDLLLAMEQAGIKIGSKGFQKDKSGEKLAENEEDLLEHRTDGTDAWDTLFVGMNKFPVESGSDISIGSVFA